jgi:DNA replication protein DnaC
MKDTCKKFLNQSKECECRDNDVFCIKLFKLQQLYDLSLLTDKQRIRIPLRIDADGTDRQAFERLSVIESDVVRYLVDSGSNLYIYSSNVGNGKTTWAIRLIQSYLTNVWYKCDIDCKALFVSVPKYLISVKENISEPNEYIQHVKKYIYSADIVVFDDIATKSATQFEHEMLFNIIDARVNLGKSNIFTSNMDYTGLVNTVGERIASRIFNTSEKIRFDGKDKRALGVSI